mmetsp:Transcript_52471/g.94045  ORF Transcript_52471/g.94045 Transcript_52471/m.94045 type:complete len:409 (+) Transcript_52471:47-1273(+)|eukprot:CAMPEP_0197663438 /NCGR_PEP_ID=MMETSP1338-20131121/57420_1 /TAXON_ID=43686 ORGANISM="Pelagodinium beii, Strain RCC1491" /NCGR_SAMPLE_ID=MMETSP1338 /ASSEMBLY_ACC=CAM_ASM_000754 /LENGTH=408 /DNA_ID=CAMNT_0043241801 /DNA_START=47 /DNA_END=1273 /DNA_ORIENTATION=-
MASALVCGGGNAAQVVSCLFGSRYKVTAISLYADEAERWAHAVKEAGCMSCAFQGTNKVVKSVPDLITKDPSAVKHCDVVLFTVPSSFHEQYFKALEPHVKEGTIFAVMPARSGCDFLFKKVMGAKADKLGFVAFETLPWACRFNDWGKTATVLGTKETIGAAVVPPLGKTKMDVVLKLQGLLGVEPMIVECPNVMSISLGNPGQVIHPGVTFGRWHAWDGKPLPQKPLFYHGVDAFTAEVLEGISADIKNICKALKSLDKDYDTSQVKTIMEWYMASYSTSITDASNLQKAMNTNTAYEGLCHPMKEVQGGYVPDFQFRYLSEDVPTGLCFTRGVAELLGVKTPTIDKVMYWCQEKLSKEFLTKGGKMAGANVTETRAPQAYGVTSKSQLCSFLKIKQTSCFAGICG